MKLLLALLFSLTARAQDASRIDPPLPVAGTPWGARIRAYALPPQDVSWLTEDVPELRCAVSVTVQPDGHFEATAGTCPPRMGEASVAATQSWAFEAPTGAAGASKFGITYVFQYSGTLGITTLHAEVDPGGEHTDEEGVPGLQLVHGAAPLAPLTAKLPKAAKKAGLGPEVCVLHVAVDAAGRAADVTAGRCAETLKADALARARKARYAPRTVDGAFYPDAIDVEIQYTR